MIIIQSENFSIIKYSKKNSTKYVLLRQFIGSNNESAQTDGHE
jgi:hypothetical protein